VAATHTPVDCCHQLLVLHSDELQKNANFITKHEILHFLHLFLGEHTHNNQCGGIGYATHSQLVVGLSFWFSLLA